MTTQAPVLESAAINRGADYIRAVQQADGAIPWFADGITDPWDHVEALMGLSVAADHGNAQRALEWLRATQNDDGSWYAAYRPGGVPEDTRVETNFTGWVATGVWHYWRVFHQRSGDTAPLQHYWPMVQRAINHVLTLQAPTGEIWWAVDQRTGISHDALVTGCSAIAKSIECADAIAATVGQPQPQWRLARQRLIHALRHRPTRFDRTWESKRRFSMDWFYPVLTGVITGAPARQRLDQHWERFVVPQMGCRCVADRPWVTIAESSELVLALATVGRTTQAREVFSWLPAYQAEDGAWWTGYEYQQRLFWPDERPTWTTAAVLLAADALQRVTPAWDLFLCPQNHPGPC